MTTYKGINGFAVQSVASDPSPLDEGQVWYNNTTYAFKLAALGSASWATAANLPSGIGSGAASGTSTAAVSFGGNATVPATGSVATNSFNGTAWTANSNMTRSPSYYGFAVKGAGSQTATLGMGGDGISTNLNLTEEFTGSSWTSKTAMPVGVRAGGAAGTSSSAAIKFGGLNDSGITAATVAFNGTTWTSGGSMSQGPYFYSGTGPSTAALASGGGSPGTFVEAYNGSTWTTKSNLPSSRGSNPGMSGNSSAALAFGGGQAQNSIWNGTSWSADTASLANNRTDSQMNATNNPSTSGIYIGGFYPAGSGYINVETYTGAAVTTKTITTS